MVSLRCIVLQCAIEHIEHIIIVSISVSSAEKNYIYVPFASMTATKLTPVRDVRAPLS